MYPLKDNILIKSFGIDINCFIICLIINFIKIDISTSQNSFCE